MSICTVEDDYVRDCMRWVVHLSDGQIVYEDDDRPGSSPPQAWLRLGNYCAEHNVFIQRMFLQFCSHVVEITPANAAGYYLSKQISAVWGEGGSYLAYIVGTLAEDGKVYVTRWAVPELVATDTEVREVEAGNQRLISRPT